MGKRKSKFQVYYDKIAAWKTPTSLKTLFKIAWMVLKNVPKISTITMRAFEISRAIEKKDLAGYLKKRKVVSEINKVLKAFGTELPKTWVNVLTELSALASKCLEEKE